jgi:hypothetical protein
MAGVVLVEVESCRPGLIVPGAVGAVFVMLGLSVLIRQPFSVRRGLLLGLGLPVLAATLLLLGFAVRAWRNKAGAVVFPLILTVCSTDTQDSERHA